MQECQELKVQPKVLLLLGSAGAPPNTKDVRGETPVMSALATDNRLGAICLLGEPCTATMLAGAHVAQSVCMLPVVPHMCMHVVAGGDLPCCSMFSVWGSNCCS